MRLMNRLAILTAILLPFFTLHTYAKSSPMLHQPKHFQKIMVVMFENMSYAEIKNEPTFKRLVEYSGHSLDAEGRLIKLASRHPMHDLTGNGYAFFSSYYNNHSGGNEPTRPSQPNYIALTSGSIQNVSNNEDHDLAIDNLAMELIDAGVSWKVYAEDLPDPRNTRYIHQSADSIDVKPFIPDPQKSEQENDAAEHQYYAKYKKQNSSSSPMTRSSCFTGHTYPSEDGYQRKHEPFISYKNIQSQYERCKNIVNSKHLESDMDQLPAVSFYIPNQINDGHNGELEQRIVRANAFLSRMMGTDPKTGLPLPSSADAPFQKFMAHGGLVVITFDEPSVIGNPDNTIYTLFAGNMVRSGAYPDKAGEHAPICYPYISEQTKYPRDPNGDYERSHCNHYNLLKLIEKNWSLRGLSDKNSSSGYKYAYPLDNNISDLWNTP